MTVFDMASDALLYYYGRRPMRKCRENRDREKTPKRAFTLTFSSTKKRGLDWLYGRGGDFSNAPDGIKDKKRERERERERKRREGTERREREKERERERRERREGRERERERERQVSGAYMVRR